MFRFVCISDTHGLHRKMQHDIGSLINPNMDNYLIHAGDITNAGKEYDVSDFISWFQNIKGFDKKIFCCGNHDLSFESKPSWLQHYINDENLWQSDVIYLQDNYFKINSPEFSRPIKIYGSPWQPTFFNWAFNLPRRGDELRNKWNMIPDDTDILITHGPPHGILDFVADKRYNESNNVGCEILLERVLELKPLIHVFGHIHGARGVEVTPDTTFVNPCICTEGYAPIYKPIVIDLTEEDGKFIVKHIDYESSM